MNGTKIVMNREQLYDEIWEYSVAGVARKHNLHYSQLINSLKEANIPYPSSGYWTRLNFGKDVSKEVVPLPNSETEELHLCPADYLTIKKSSNKKRTVNSIGNALLDEQDSEGTGDVEKGIAPYQRFICDAGLAFLEKEDRKKVVDVIATMEIKDNSRLHKSVIAYKQSVKEWKRKRETPRNYYESKAEPPPYVKDVSVECLQRVERILDVLFRAIEKLDGEVLPNLSVKIRSDNVGIKFAEGQDKIPHEITKEEAKNLLEYKEALKLGRYASKPQIRKYDHVYNGKLRIVFDDGKYIRDNDNIKIEDRLDEILIRLYQISEEHRIAREKREEEQRKRDEERRLKEEQDRRLEEEKLNTQALVNQSSDYKTACEIRSLIAAVKQMGNVEDNAAWLDWAEKKANWYDPTTAYEDEYLGKRNHSLSEEEKSLQRSTKRSFYGW